MLYLVGDFMFVDSYCYFDFLDFDGERDDLIIWVKEVGVGLMVIICICVCKFD